jgi:hypothetical protein
MSVLAGKKRVDAAPIIEDAKATGIKPPTLRRARIALGWVADRNDETGSWYWYIP